MSNIWISWGDVFNTSLQSLWFGFVQFAPKLILAVVFFIVGWMKNYMHLTVTRDFHLFGFRHLAISLNHFYHLWSL